MLDGNAFQTIQSTYCTPQCNRTLTPPISTIYCIRKNGFQGGKVKGNAPLLKRFLLI